MARPVTFLFEFQRATAVIACDKREAFAHGSVSDEAIHSFVTPRYGLLRFARNDEQNAISRSRGTMCPRFVSNSRPSK